MNLPFYFSNLVNFVLFQGSQGWIFSSHLKFFQVSCHFSMIFIKIFKILWYFQVFQVYSHFSRSSGNPENCVEVFILLKRQRPMQVSTRFCISRNGNKGGFSFKHCNLATTLYTFYWYLYQFQCRTVWINHNTTETIGPGLAAALC